MGKFNYQKYGLIIAFSSLVVTSLSLFNLPFSFQIIGEDVVGINVPYTATISLTAPNPPDLDYTDGTITKYRAGTKVLDENKNYVFENPEVDLETQSFEDSITWTPTIDGKYVIMAVIAQKINTYNFTSRTWLGWSGEIEVAREEKVITVEGVSPPEDPTWDLKVWVLNIINGITSWFCSNMGIFC